MTFEEFSSKYTGRLERNKPLARITSIHLGGLAALYFDARTAEEISDAVSAAESSGYPFVVIGGGSNTLFSDQGFSGLVIHVMLNGLERLKGGLIRAEAGVPMVTLGRFTANAGLTGLEWAGSLPGTVGGAVYGNSGCFGSETCDLLESVEILRADERLTLKTGQCSFGYRESIFKHRRDVILSAIFSLSFADRDACLARLVAITEKRKASQPAGVSSAGCIFKNFQFEQRVEIEKLIANRNVPPEFIAKKVIPVGWLIDQAELKGFAVGGASISIVHGNFLVTSPKARAEHILELIAVIKTKIRNLYGLQLEEEVQFIPFEGRLKTDAKLIS